MSASPVQITSMTVDDQSSTCSLYLHITKSYLLLSFLIKGAHVPLKNPVSPVVIERRNPKCLMLCLSVFTVTVSFWTWTSFGSFRPVWNLSIKLWCGLNKKRRLLIQFQTESGAFLFTVWKRSRPTARFSDDGYVIFSTHSKADLLMASCQGPII